jgi:D-tyrosyl-tRNA(Tyr) deacylase
MKLLIQRVTQAQVDIKGKTVGKIGPGMLVFIGIAHSDTQEEVRVLSKKLVHLRIFSDEAGKMNRSLLDIQGEALIVSQFTLYGDCKEGRRPSFIEAARPEHAQVLYEKFIEEVKALGVAVQTGVFGAEMKVSLINDGPVTLIL